MKFFSIFLISIFVITASISGITHAEQQEQWEKDLNTCVNQKKAVSVHITLDTSGSTGGATGSDPDGVRGTATIAITLGLQKITKELQTSEYENVDMEISWSTFDSTAKVVLDWTDLSTSSLTNQQLSLEKSVLNRSDGGTTYLNAIDLATNMFSSKRLANSCDIWIFMTDGASGGSYQDILRRIESLQSRGVFLIGVALSKYDLVCLDFLLGEVAGSCSLGSDINFTNNKLYLKSKVFPAKDATDILNAFLRISNQLRAVGFNQDKEDLATEQTLICTENNECFYELSVGVGTQTAIIQMNVSKPGNIGDIELLIEPPPALNVAENLKLIPPIGLTKTQFGDTKVEVEWYSEEVGLIKIDFDPQKNSWVGSWKFSLKASDPQGRTVDWTTTLFTKLVPEIPKDVSLRIGQEQCIEITYSGSAPPPNADVKLLIVDPSDGSIVKSVKANEIPRGHEACITPDETLPNKVKLQTEVMYEPAKGKKAYADVASTNIIEILEAPIYNKISGPLDTNKQLFKGQQNVVFEFELEGGNIDSVINVIVNELSNNGSPNVTWSIEYKGSIYRLGTEDLPIKIGANEVGVLKLIGEPYEAANLNSDTMYEVNFKSSMPSISTSEEVSSFQINTRFLNVPIPTILKYAFIIFLIFFGIGLLCSYLFSFFRSGLVFERNIRTKTYPVRVGNDGSIEWVGDNFYNDTYDNTRVLLPSSKNVSLANSLKIQYKQKLFPFIQESSAELSSRNNFISIYNKAFESKKAIDPDINKLWIFEMESGDGSSAVGSITIVANNEQTFDLLKDSLKTGFALSDFSNIRPGDATIAPGWHAPEPDSTFDEDDGSGGPPPPPG